jgi:hypothetical protein
MKRLQLHDAASVQCADIHSRLQQRRVEGLPFDGPPCLVVEADTQSNVGQLTQLQLLVFSGKSEELCQHGEREDGLNCSPYLLLGGRVCESTFHAASHGHVIHNLQALVALVATSASWLTMVDVIKLCHVAEPLCTCRRRHTILVWFGWPIWPVPCACGKGLLAQHK